MSGRPKTAMDKVSKKLDHSEYVIIPTDQVGTIIHSTDCDGNIREDAITLDITNIDEMIYADKIQILLGGD